MPSVREKIAAADRANRGGAGALNKLALVGDEPRSRFGDPAKLDATGQLAASQKGWIQALEEGIAALPK